MRFTSEVSVLLYCTALSNRYSLHNSTVFGVSTQPLHELTMYDCPWLAVSDVWVIELPPQIFYVLSQLYRHGTGFLRPLSRCS